MHMANKSALFEVYVHAFSITHATIQLPIYPADPPLLVRTNVQYLVVHTIYFRCGHLGQRKELDST